MIHYTVLPLEAVMQGMDTMDHSDLMELTMNGIPMQVKPVGSGQAVVVRLLSCNPQDYLHPGLSPGSIIEFEPVFQ